MDSKANTCFTVLLLLASMLEGFTGLASAQPTEVGERENFATKCKTYFATTKTPAEVTQIYQWTLAELLEFKNSSLRRRTVLALRSRCQFYLCWETDSSSSRNAVAGRLGLRKLRRFCSQWYGAFHSHSDQYSTATLVKFNNERF